MYPISTDDDTLKLPTLTGEPKEAKTPAASKGWLEAAKQVLPVYVFTHIAFVLLTYLTTLLLLPWDARVKSPVRTLLGFWNQWDTVHFVAISISGYFKLTETAFFPLYPVLIHIFTFVLANPLISALFIANLAEFGMLTVFYKLVAEDFGAEQAWRGALYFVLFPTAFFLAAAYSESLFLFLVLLSFYWMRCGRWWLAGLAALFASLTRSTAIALFVPFCYEYLRQRDFQWKKIRFDVVSCAGIGAGIGLFSLYCYLTFHDPLAFSHAEEIGWQRHWTFPWEALFNSASYLFTQPLLQFFNTYNAVTLGAALLVLALLVLSFIGPWKLAAKDWSYPLYTAVILLFCLCVSPTNGTPLQAFDRLMLAAFPIFITLAAIGKNRHFHLAYILICLPFLSFMLVLFFTGKWMV